MTGEALPASDVKLYAMANDLARDIIADRPQEAFDRDIPKLTDGAAAYTDRVVVVLDS